MFKNEAPRIQEWIEYHRIIGVEHFYLYNNDGFDNFIEILTPYIKEGLVDLISWDSKTAPFDDPRQSVQWVGFQLSAFNDCIKKVSGVSKWLAIIDIDEFLFSLEEKEGIIKILENTPCDVGYVSFFWKCFGTSNLWEIPPKRLVTELLVLRGMDNIHTNQHKKSILRPEAVSYTLVHESFLKDGYKNIMIDPNKARVNHYLGRGRKEVIEKQRGDLSAFEKMHNAVFDNSMMEYIPLIKERMRDNGIETN
jgi:hypothetical protein